jgi:hypothetical protein
MNKFLEDLFDIIHLIFLVMIYHIFHDLLFVEFVPNLLPPNFPSVFDTIHVLSHECISYSPISHVCLFFRFASHLIVSILLFHFNFFDLSIQILDFGYYILLVVVVSNFSESICIFIPNFECSHFHKFIHFAQNSIPVSFSSSIPI